MKSFYITTAIDYVNNLPHLGTAYEKIGADVIARFKRQQGFDVHFQMGSDEHSTNVEKAAKEKNLSCKEYCDQMRVAFEKVWQDLNISYDGFIQTSDAEHEKSVQKLFHMLHEKGEIYKAPYKGWYCESCEAFYTEKDLEEGKCPNHKNKPKWIEEENYFFSLSKYQDRLLKHIQENPNFILPTKRRNEVLRFIETGLEDISVSRASASWGIPLPSDKDHVVYVWFDALINYITAIGFASNEKTFKEKWPASMHIIGKDITRFHCIIWPAMLMAAGIELPENIFGHGFVYLKGEKMSKTLGNVVTPMDIVPEYGADPLRYYLLRTSSFGSDADFTWNDFIRRYNGDLANGLGNVIQRTVGMIDRYLNGEITPSDKPPGKQEKELELALTSIHEKVASAMSWDDSDIDFHDALSFIWEGLTGIDLYINNKAPWKLAKAQENESLHQVLHQVTEGIRILSILLFAFLPTTAENIWNKFGFSQFGQLKDQPFSAATKWNLIKQKIVIQKSEGLFPRIETKKEKEPKVEPNKNDDLITIQDFAKVELKLADILEAEKVEGADKLLKLQVSLGEEKRQLVAGIAQHYSPEDLIGKQVVVVANLQPAKIRGVESQGMILAANSKEGIFIVTPEKPAPAGTKVR